MKIWRKLKSKIVHKNPWYSVIEDEVIQPDGKRGKYYVIKNGPGVVIIPFDGKKIYLTNQYRYPLKKRFWELPAGHASGKNMLNNAKKELKEETGISARTWNYLGKFAPVPGESSCIGHSFLAENLIYGKHKREGGEQDMKLKTFTLGQIDKMILKGEIIDSWLIASLYFFRRTKNL